MHPGMARAFNGEMIAALHAKGDVSGHALHVLHLEEYSLPAHDAVRCQFWLGAKQSESATYTFTFTSDLSIAENLADLEDYVRERFGVATQCPV